MIAARRPRNHRFRVEYCSDFERLAALAERCHDPKLLQPNRSAAYLRWVYGPLPEVPDDKQARLVYTFRRDDGSEGWFAVTFARRGRLDQIRTTRLLDVVWPSDKLAFPDLLPAILEVAATRSDLLSIRGRTGLGLGHDVKGLRRRNLLAPEGYFVSRNPPTPELVTVADFPFADRY